MPRRRRRWLGVRRGVRCSPDPPQLGRGVTCGRMSCATPQSFPSIQIRDRSDDDDDDATMERATSPRFGANCLRERKTKKNCAREALKCFVEGRVENPDLRNAPHSDFLRGLRLLFLVPPSVRPSVRSLSDPSSARLPRFVILSPIGSWRRRAAAFRPPLTTFHIRPQ